MMTTRKFGLIGQKLGHSFSKDYFTAKFQTHAIPATYSNFELDVIEDVQRVLQSDIIGFNVTIPYKTSIIPYLDGIVGAAAEIGAVNTVKRVGSKWIGYNTDVFGFRQMIKPYFKSHHERAMILGTGGASKAVAHVLEHLGVDLINISRSPHGENQYGYNDINENMIRFNGIIVNTTPIGTWPDIASFPAIPYDFLTNNHLVIDLIYNPEETVFLNKARAAGAVILNGKTMLHQQAEEAWRIWNQT
jgi:shikimate dehydrogenase